MDFESTSAFLIRQRIGLAWNALSNAQSLLSGINWQDSWQGEASLLATKELHKEQKKLLLLLERITQIKQQLTDLESQIKIAKARKIQAFSLGV